MRVKWRTTSTYHSSGTFYSGNTQYFSAAGIWYLHVKTSDGAEHKVFGPYIRDYNSPNAPTITAPSGWINYNPTITIADNGDVGSTGTDIDGATSYYISGVKQTLYSYNNVGWYTYSSGIVVSGNGSHTIYAKVQDKVINESTVVSKSFSIDTTLPSGTFTSNSSSWTKNNVSVSFNPSDSGGSGVKQWRYKTSTNNGSTWSAWSSYIAGDITSNITLSAAGSNKIQAEVTDNAGNIGYPTSGTYYIDKTLPTTSVTGIWGTDYQNGNHYWVKPNKSVTVLAKYSDNVGVHLAYIRALSTDNSTDVRRVCEWGSSDWEFMSSGNISTTGIYDTGGSAWRTLLHAGWNMTPTSAEKDYYLESYVTDISGNEVGYNRGSPMLRVDGTAPTINGTTTYDWTNANVTISASATDARSGMKSITIKNSSGTQVASEASSLSYTVTGSGTITYTVTATDNVGNVSNKNITVNIDRIAPGGTFTPSSQTWTNGKITTNFNPSDTGGSGVNQWKYRISTNNGSTWSEWSSAILGDTSSNITLTSAGTNLVQCWVQDKANNQSYITSGVFQIYNYNITPTEIKIYDSSNNLVTGYLTQNLTYRIEMTYKNTGVDTLPGFRACKKFCVN